MDNFTLGDELKAEYCVSYEVYKGFLDVFKDDNLMHTSAHYANKYGFNEIVMHGNILNGFISNFIGTKLPTKNLVIISQQIKFRNPVYLNDRIQIKSIVNEIHEAFGLVILKMLLTNHEGHKVASSTVEVKIL